LDKKLTQSELKFLYPICRELEVRLEDIDGTLKARSDEFSGCECYDDRVDDRVEGNDDGLVEGRKAAGCSLSGSSAQTCLNDIPVENKASRNPFLLLNKTHI
jgi:hypothetical protein